MADALQIVASAKTAEHSAVGRMESRDDLVRQRCCLAECFSPPSAATSFVSGERISFTKVVVFLLLLLIDRNFDSVSGKIEALPGKSESLSGKNESPMTGKMMRGNSHNSGNPVRLYGRTITEISALSHFKLL